MVQNIQTGSNLKHTLHQIEELMIWRDPKINPCSIFHAIAYYGNGNELMNTISNYNPSNGNSNLLRSAIKTQDSNGDTCVHLASLANNYDFLKYLFGETGIEVLSLILIKDVFWIATYFLKLCTESHFSVVSYSYARRLTKL